MKSKDIIKYIEKRLTKIKKEFDRYDKQRQESDKKSEREYGEFMAFRMLSVIDELEDILKWITKN